MLQGEFERFVLLLLSMMSGLPYLDDLIELESYSTTNFRH